jgi:tetratricopeptide (TPR) repeat protein
MKQATGMLLALAFALAPSSAWAEECKSELGKKLREEGANAYNLREDEEAIRKWKEAYRECADPDILYNLGQASRRLGQFGKARDYYKAYVRENPGASDRDKAEEKIAEMERRIAENKKSAEAPPSGTKPEPAQKDQPPSRRWYRDRVGWILAGSGVATILAGSGFVLWAGSTADEARTTLDHAEATSLFDDADTRLTIGVGAIAVGGALLVGGALRFYLYERSAPRGVPTVAVTPTSIHFAWSF